jgi:hypothetical protein
LKDARLASELNSIDSLLKTLLHPFEPPLRLIPEYQGYDVGLTIVDWFVEAVKYEVTHLELNSEGFARILQDWVICDHGLPHQIICDCDIWYMKELFAILSTKQNLSITYHPQTNGQTKQMNQNIEQYLCGFINYHQDDWKEWLFTAEFSYINSVHTAMQKTPFFLKYGQYPWIGEDTRWEVRNESAAEFADHMKKARLDGKEALEQAAQKMKWSYDKHARPAIE